MSAPTPPFEWRRECAWLALPVALCLAFRLAAAPLALATLNGDAAIHLLAAKHLTEGKVSLHYYGQTYVGSFEAWLAAPFYLLLGADPAGMGYAQALISAAVVVALYRLAWALGGRSAALGAGLPFAIGTALALANTAGQYASYPTTLLVGILVWIVALPLFERPTRARVAAVGALAGFGAWNNPQISSFLAPLLFLALLHGRALGAARAGTLAGRLGRWRRPLLLAGAAACLAIAFATLNAIALPWLPYKVTTLEGETHVGRRLPVPDGRLHLIADDGTEIVIERHRVASEEPAGRLEVGPLSISLTRPYRYLVRAIFALGAVVAATELLAAASRRAALAWVAVAMGGFFVGWTPEVAFALTRERTFEGREIGLKAAPLGLDPGNVSTHAATFATHLGYALFNQPTPADGRESIAYGPARTFAIAAAVAALALAVWRGRRTVGELVRLRPPTALLPALLALHAAGLAVLYLTFPNAPNEARYLSPAWIPLAGLYAALVHAAWTWRRPAGGALGLGLVAVFALAQVHNLARLVQDGESRVAYDRRIGDDAAKRGVTAGYANFWVGYPATYRADERVALATWGPPDQLFHYVPYHERARRADRKLWVFEPVNSHVDRRVMHRLLAGETSDRVVERWMLGGPRGRPGGHGPYLMLLTERRAR